LLLLLVLTFLLGGLFAIDGVQYSRIAGLAVMIMAFPALWARQVLSASRVAVQSWGAPLSGLLLAAAMIAIGLVNFRYTFKEHDRISWSEGPMRRTTVMTALTRNLRDWGERNFTFVHTSIDFDPNHRSVRFIAPDCTAAVFDSVEGLDLSLARGFDTITFAVAAASKKQIAELREAFPGGEDPEAAIEFHDPGDVAMLYRIRTPSKTEQPQ
jgi:hypothetical protein